MDCTSQQFFCKCGKTQSYIFDGEIKGPCPVCKRQYRGKYNKRKFGIEAIEIDRWGKIYLKIWQKVSILALLK
jgi:hypothetical protein